MGNPEQTGKSYSYLSHCKPCQGSSRKKETKNKYFNGKEKKFLVNGRKYRATQTQVIKFFVDENLPNLALNLAP